MRAGYEEESVRNDGKRRKEDTLKKSRRSSTLLAVLLVLLAVTPAMAQEITGSIGGVVTDDSGAALPGASVTLTGAGYPAGTQAFTNDKGRFRFPAVPPGDYSLRVSLESFQTVEVKQFRVALEEALSFEVTLPLSDVVEETITVTAEAPMFSMTSSDTSATISGMMIEKLAIGQDFTDLVSQAAGAQDEDDVLGGISIDGSSGAENRFVVDGVDTTNLQEGTSQQTVMSEFLEEVQVKQGGYMAEFGGSTGGVINAVTKQGGNDFTGDVHFFMSPESGFGDDRPELRRNPETQNAEEARVSVDDRERTQPGFTLGGPILKDRMWFFAGYSPSKVDITRTLTYEDGSTVSFDRSTENDYITGNISGTVGKLYYRLGANFDDSERENLMPTRDALGSDDPEDYAEDRSSPSESYNLSFNYAPSANALASARGGHYQYDTQDSGFFTGTWWGPSTSSAGTMCDRFPTECDPSQDPGLGSATPNNTGTVFDYFERDYAQVDGTFFFDAGGDHELKVGALFEEYANEVLDGYSNTRILFYIDRSRTNLEGDRVRGPYGNYRVLQIATQGEISSENTGLFLQDTWQVNDRLTLNLGVRAEEEKIPSYAAQSNIPKTAIQFDFDDKIAPRLGFAYDVRGDGNWKAFGSYGVFYDNTKLEMPRGSFGGAKWVDFFYALETTDFNSIVSGCQIVENSIDSMPTGCPGTFLFLADRRHPSNDPDDPTIEPNMKPMESNEITLGFEHLLGRNMTLGLRYVHKELKRTIEDVGVVVPGVGEVFYIANPGEGIAQNILGPGFPDQPKAVRDYDGLTLTFRKSYSDNWALSATYTYSELEGNYSGLSSSDEDGRTSPNVNRFFDSLNGTFGANGQPVYGPLGSDRPHQFKAQLIYKMPWDTFLGINQRIASGLPVTTEYTVSPGLPFHPYGRGDLGRTPKLSQTDIQLSHEFRFSGNYGIQLSLNVRNLFDEDVMTNYWEDALLEDIPITDAEFFAGFDPEALIATNDIPRDPRFGLPDDYQGRREMRVGVKFMF